jgi:hypothetical protein
VNKEVASNEIEKVSERNLRTKENENPCAGERCKCAGREIDTTADHKLISTITVHDLIDFEPD